VIFLENRLLSTGFADENFPFSVHVGETSTSFGWSSFGDILFYKIALARVPSIRKGDVIGCGLSFLKNQVFFTKNGRLLGMIKIPKKIGRHFPTVSLNGPKAAVEFNFGKVPFKFNLSGYIQKENEEVICEMMQPFEEDPSLSLIASYLYLNGFKETFESFLKSAKIKREAVQAFKQGYFEVKQDPPSKIEEEAPSEDTNPSQNATENSNQTSPDSPRALIMPITSSRLRHDIFFRQMLSSAFRSLVSRTPPSHTQTSSSQNSVLQGFRPRRSRLDSMELDGESILQEAEELSSVFETQNNLVSIDLPKEKLQSFFECESESSFQLRSSKNLKKKGNH
jgi:SPRY domain